MLLNKLYNIIRFIFIVWSLYMGYVYIIKPLLKILLQEALDKEFQKFSGNHEEPRRPVGSIHIDHIPEKTRKNSGKNDVEGEYVDYEEVK